MHARVLLAQWCGVGIHNEKTRRVKAVKRRGPSERFAGVSSLRKVAVLARGALENEAGEHARGWSLRSHGEKKSAAWFAERSLGPQGMDLDVMISGECVALLHVEPPRSEHPDAAQLRALDGTLLAAVNRGICHDPTGNELVRWSVENEKLISQCHADRRVIGTLERTRQRGMILTTYDLELTFETQATGFERVLFSSMIVLYHVQQLPEWQAD
jgi:hypothetical protein